jgi:regulator of sirC expression with transglutaminase-like and TPR domain
MYQPVSPLEYFRLLVGGSEGGDIPLLEAAASLAQDAHPELDLQETLAAFDRLAQDMAQACRKASTETTRLQRALHCFFVTQGFAGNRQTYYDPGNSYLHRVMKTRTGIPISLAVLFTELTRHVGLDVDGVAFPGHFLVRVNLHEGLAVIDPFTGQSIDRAELERRAAPYGVPVERLLHPASPRQILIRMLNNLAAIHARQNEGALLEKVTQRLAMLGATPGA